MGVNSDSKTNWIGEFEVIGGESPEAKISVNLIEPKRLSIIILNISGQSMLQKELDGIQGQNEVIFDVSKFKSGEYNAWIECDGQTFIRQIKIQSNGIGKKFKLAGLIKSIFS